MAEWPVVTIQVITYDRFSTLLKTLTALHRRIQYPADKLRFLVCDDHTPYPDFVDRLQGTKIWQKLPHAEVWRWTERGGWGRNVNLGMTKVDSPYIFFTEDDYIPKVDIDLYRAVAVMEQTPSMGMLRFRGTGAHVLIYHGMEADIRGWLPDYREGWGYVSGKASYLLIDGGSPGFYVYSNGPHLKRQSFHQFYGDYPEGRKLGETEESYAHMVRDRMGEPDAPTIGILPDYLIMRFDHIGQSYQLGEHDN